MMSNEHRSLAMVAIVATGGLAAVACNESANTGGAGGASNAVTAGVTSGGATVTTSVTSGTGGSESSNFAAAQTNLASDSDRTAANIDPKLANAWGVVIADEPAGAEFWVAANHTGRVETYDARGKLEGSVNVPAAMAGDTGSPTGLAYNETKDFLGDELITATEDGLILGWSQGDSFRTRYSNGGAVYKGLAILDQGEKPLLLAANFGGGTIEVYDADYRRVSMRGAFEDPTIPSGYGPFNVATIGDRVYVAYAVQDAKHEDDVPGAGHGFVSVFSANGRYEKTLVSKGLLDSPWGMMLAPSSFLGISGALLVGNFGDGAIHAYDRQTGNLVATFVFVGGDTLRIDGLWGLAEGPKTSSYDLSHSIYFAAGPADEEHGLFGKLSPMTVTPMPLPRP